MALGQQLRAARLARNLSPSEVAAATHLKVQIIEALEDEDFSDVPATIYGKGFIRLYAEHVGLDPRPLIDEYVSGIAPIEKDQKKPELSVRAETAESRPAAAPVEAQPLLFEDASYPEAVEDIEPEFAVDPTPAEEDIPVFDDSLEPRELDLFVREEARIGERSPVIPKAESSAIQSAVERIGESSAGLWDKGVNAIPDRLKRAGQSLTRTEKEVIEQNFFGSPVRAVCVFLAVVVLLVFVISSLSRYVRRSGEDPHSPAMTETPASEIRLAVPLSEPYFD